MSVPSTRARLVAAAALVAMPTLAGAQPAGNIDLSGFRPAIDSRGYLTVSASQVLGHTELSFGLGALDGGYKLLEFDGNGGSYTVDNIITATLIAAFGVKAGPVELEFAASAPLRIMGADREPDADSEEFGFDGQGLGNVGLHLKTRLLKTSQHPVGLGLIASVFLPTTNPKDRFLGEDQLVPQLMMIVDKEQGARRRRRLALNAGFRLRSETRTFTDSDPTDPSGRPAPITNGTLTRAAA